MSEAWLETEATRCWIRASQALAKRARVQGRVVKAEIHDSTPSSNPVAGISRAEEEGKVGDTENLKRNSKDQISRSLRVLRVHASGLVVTDGRHKARAALESKGGPRELVTAECQPGTMLEVLECCLAFDDIALGRPLANRKHGSIIPLEIKPAFFFSIRATAQASDSDVPFVSHKQNNTLPDALAFLNTIFAEDKKLLHGEMSDLLYESAYQGKKDCSWKPTNISAVSDVASLERLPREISAASSIVASPKRHGMSSADPLNNSRSKSSPPRSVASHRSNDSECWDAGHWGSAAPFLGTQSPRASQTSNDQQAQVKEGESEDTSQHEHSEEVQNLEDNSRGDAWIFECRHNESMTWVWGWINPPEGVEKIENRTRLPFQGVPRATIEPKTWDFEITLNPELVWTGSAILEDIACKPWAFKGSDFTIQASNDEGTFKGTLSTLSKPCPISESAVPIPWPRKRQSMSSPARISKVNKLATFARDFVAQLQPAKCDKALQTDHNPMFKSKDTQTGEVSSPPFVETKHCQTEFCTSGSGESPSRETHAQSDVASETGKSLLATSTAESPCKDRVKERPLLATSSSSESDDKDGSESPLTQAAKLVDEGSQQSGSSSASSASSPERKNSIAADTKGQATRGKRPSKERSWIKKLWRRGNEEKGSVSSSSRATSKRRKLS